MKATKSTRRARHDGRRVVLGTLGAMTLSAVMLLGVSCTRNDLPDNPKDTAGTNGGTPAVTTPATLPGNTPGTTKPSPDNKPSGTGGSTAKPLDPDAGTVDPNAGTGEPPAGSGESKNFRSRFMH